MDADDWLDPECFKTIMEYRDMTGGKVKVEDRGEEYVGMETEEKE